jgi:hypothetical protein
MAKKARTPPPPRVNAPKRRDDQRVTGLTLDRRILYAAGAGIVILVAVILLVTLTGGSKSDAKVAQGVDFSQLTGLQQGPPPWNNGAAALPDNIAALGLNQLTNEGQVLHIHEHLDVWVNGKKVAVPALIGIYANQFITEVHTHDTRGVIHVESPKKRDFTLGQLFGEWGVKLTSSCIGTYCGGVHWWVNGKQETGNPADLVLKSHQEIVVVHGKSPAKIPQKYAFSAGE